MKGSRNQPASIGTAGHHRQEGIAEISPRGTVFSPTEVMFAVGQEGGGRDRWETTQIPMMGDDRINCGQPPHTHIWPLDCYAAIRKIL